MSTTLNLILKHWTDKKLPLDRDFVFLPFHIENFCVENDENINAANKRIAELEAEITRLKSELSKKESNLKVADTILTRIVNSKVIQECEFASYSEAYSDAKDYVRTIRGENAE